MADLRSETWRSQDPGPGHTASTAPDSSTRASTPASAGSVSDTARAQAGAIWNEAKDRARTTLDEQQKSAAAGIGEFAGALRNAAGDLEHRNSTTVAQVAQRAADGLERLAGTLRNKDAGTMVRDLESFARQQPAVFLGGAVALGFLAMRFLKASSTPAASSTTSTYGSSASKSTNSTTFQGELHGYDHGQTLSGE